MRLIPARLLAVAAWCFLVSPVCAQGNDSKIEFRNEALDDEQRAVHVDLGDRSVSAILPSIPGALYGRPTIDPVYLTHVALGTSFFVSTSHLEQRLNSWLLHHRRSRMLKVRYLNQKLLASRALLLSYRMIARAKSSPVPGCTIQSLVTG